MPQTDEGIPLLEWGVDSDCTVRKDVLETMDHRAEWQKRQNLTFHRGIESGLRSLGDCVFLLDRAEMFIGRPVGGTTADLGSGFGTLAAALSKRPSVDKVYAVEYSRGHVVDAMPKAFQAFGARTEKIVRCWGSFNDVKLPDESLDVAAEFGAFHHSEDLPRTIHETWRLLKPGGWFVGIERSHRNYLSNTQLEKLLDKPLSDLQKSYFGFAEDQPATRRDVGEHEHRDCDWLHYFESAGFEPHILPFRAWNRRRLPDLAKAAFSRVLGDWLVRRRNTAVTYVSWFNPNCSRSLLLARKPD